MLPLLSLSLSFWCAREKNESFSLANSIRYFGSDAFECGHGLLYGGFHRRIHRVPVPRNLSVLVENERVRYALNVIAAHICSGVVLKKQIMKIPQREGRSMQSAIQSRHTDLSRGDNRTKRYTSCLHHLRYRRQRRNPYCCPGHQRSASLSESVRETQRLMRVITTKKKKKTLKRIESALL